MTRDRQRARMTRRRLLQLGSVGVVASAATTLLAACGGEGTSEGAPTAEATSGGAGAGSTTATTEPAGTPEAGSGETEQVGPGKYGGVFRAAVESAPPTLDLAITLAAAAREAVLFWHETLVAYAENYEIIPVLAERWEVSDDGLTYTFALRKGVKFHNGKEMTSEDVLASTERFLAVTARKSSFEMIESYEAPDDYTVVFRLSYATMTLLDALAYPVGTLVIFPKEVIEGKEAGKLTDADMIGTGPYKFAEWKPDQYLKVVRFEDYQPLGTEVDGLGGGKIPYFDEIYLYPVPESAARVAGLETGEYDYAAAPPTTDYDRLDQNPDITPYIIEDQRWVVILFNFRNPLTSNLAFRRAVQAALDIDALGQAITNGRKEFYRVQPSLWFSSSPWHTEVGAELYNQKNPEKAKQFLQEAGYNGEEVVLLTNRNYDYMYKCIVTAAEQLKAIGMNTRVDILDWPAQQARWKEPDWHLSVTGYLSQGMFAPDAFAAFYGGGGADAGAGYNNPDMTKAFQDAMQATTLEDRKKAFEEVQRIWYEDVTGIKTVDTFGLAAIRSDIKGYKPWYNTSRFWSCWRED